MMNYIMFTVSIEVDVFIAVEIEENELFTGIYRRNITLTLKSSIHNQIPGLLIFFFVLISIF